jgi:DNA-binding MarR family transcriptional regulator
MTETEINTEAFFHLLQRFIHLRPTLSFPEHLVKFQQQMESVRSSNPCGVEDYAFLFRVFMVLTHQPIPPTMTELSEALGIPLSSATRMVDWLVRGRFVERATDPFDRRVVRVQVTDSGNQFIQVGMAHNKERLSRLLATFSAEEQDQLLRMLDKLLSILEAEGKSV